MNLKTTLAALRSGWQFIAVGLLIALGVAFALHSSSTPMYESTATYVISPSASSDNLIQAVNSLDSSRSRSIMTTLTEITMSDAVRAEALGQLGIDPSTAESYTVTSIVIPEANVIQTTVIGPDPDVVTDLTTLVGDIGSVRFIGLYQVYDVAVLDAAVAPTSPSNTGLPTLIVLTSLLGIAAGAGAALLRFAAGGSGRRTVRNRLSAYDPTVTPIEEHSRFQRVG
jgi:uncharacterized protein involved in exopolysaccharide biosynthesis